MDKIIEIAGKSYEVESYSDEHKIYVEAGSLMHVVTSDNAEEVVADLVDIAGGIALESARSMIEGEAVPQGDCEVMMSFDNIDGESVYILACVHFYADESLNGKMYTDVSVCLPQMGGNFCDYTDDVKDAYDVICEELNSLVKHERARSDEMDEIIEENHNWGATDKEQD